MDANPHEWKMMEWGGADKVSSDGYKLANGTGIQYGLIMSEIIFEVEEDDNDGGYVATALGHSIVTEGSTIEELREMVKDAVRCHFGDGALGASPQIIRLHFVRDEVLAA